MAHHIYHTRGLILGSYPAGESNRFYKIFTEELGLVSAAAQAVREGKSKLRYTLQDFSWIQLDLVRGKEVWRITSAVEAGKLDDSKEDNEKLSLISSNQPQFKLFARVCSLVLRFVQGEGKDEELFNDILEVTLFLRRELIPANLVLSFETLAEMRILAFLGYLDPKPYQEFLKSGDWSLHILEEFEEVRSKANVHISEALYESHL